MNSRNDLDKDLLFESDKINLKIILSNLKTWVKFLATKRIFIFKVFLFSLLIGFLLIYTQRIQYKAVLTFAMEEDKGVGGSLAGSAAGIASQIGIDIGGAGGSAFAANNLMELMKSKFLIEKTLLDTIRIDNKSITLADYYADVEGLRKKWNKNPNLVGINFHSNTSYTNHSLTQDSLLKVIYKRILSKNIVVQPKDKKVTIMYLEIKSKSEIFSKYFCEYLTKETSDFYIETKTKKAKNNVDILQKQVDSIRSNLNDAINGVAIAVDNVYNLNPAYNIKSSNSKKRQVEVQANSVILTQLLAQLELAKINLRKETPLIQIIDRPKLPLDDDKYVSFIVIFLFSIFSIILSVSFLIIKKILIEN